MRAVRAAVAAVGVFCATTAVVADDTIALNEEFKGKMAAAGGKGVGPKGGGFGGPKGGGVASHSVEVKLKTGQKVEVSVSVTGDDRKTGVALFDPNGKLLSTSWTLNRGDSDARNSFASLAQFSKKQVAAGLGKSAKLSVGEVPDTGKYTVTVYSDLAGEYTLLVRDPSKAAVRDAETIRRELKEARRRVEELERELKEKGDKPEEAPRPALKVGGKG